MIFEDLELIWRDEKSHPSHTIDDEALRRIVADRARAYRKKILWKDGSDIGVHAVTVIFVISVCIWATLNGGGFASEGIGPMLVIAIGYTFVTSFRLVGRLRQKGREKKFDDSIHGNLQKLVANADYQIRLQSKYLWWYVLPIVPGYALLVGSFWDEGPEAFTFMTLTMIFIFGTIIWANRHALRTDLIPQKEELESLLAGLENGGKSVEIRAATDPSVKVQIPLSRRIFALAIALTIFAVAGLVLFNGFRSTKEPQAPEFSSIVAFSESDKEKIDAWLEHTVERSHYPSLSVAIVRHGKLVYQGAFGFENTWTRRVATTNSAYHIASVSKAFTAALAALLHERGVVDLDQPVVKYLPKSVSISTTPEVGAQITLRQLASHTSGLPKRVPGKVQSVEWRYELEPQRLYYLLADVTMESLPGHGSSYSNLGFGLLGHALELAAQKPLNELLQEHICKPLNLERTAYHVDPDLEFATGYTTPPRLPERHSYKQRLAGSGGIVSSTGDLAKFVAANMAPGLFSTNALKELHTDTKLKNGRSTFRGLGWHIDSSHPGGRLLSKNGGRKNCSAWIGFAPEHGVGVVVLTNIGEPDVDPIGLWLLARSMPGGDRPTSENGYVKAGAFTGVRWENNLPIVQVEDRWSQLVSIDGIPIERIIEHAQTNFGRTARMRFGEDLPEVLASMGHHPDWEVTLGLKTENEPVEQLKVKLTKANRDLVRDKRLESE
jgi:CubicO group peptidase (beta-lactamase class C family)